MLDKISFVEAADVELDKVFDVHIHDHRGGDVHLVTGITQILVEAVGIELAVIMKYLVCRYPLIIYSFEPNFDH